MSELPAPDPVVQDDARPFWEAAADGRLSVPRCDRCATVIWYPRGFCPACGSLDVTWIDLPGTGTVYSLAVPRRGQGAYRDAAPYVLAYVELDLPDPTDAGAGEASGAAIGAAAGPRIITNVVDCDPDSVRIGDRVAVVFDPTASGHALVRFRPA